MTYITEYSLLASGFENADIVARKIVKAFALFRNSFSRMPYYDHSIRSVLNVVSLMEALNKSLFEKKLS